jgi:ABC-type glycerol-3-phosphate transport system permease component
MKAFHWKQVIVYSCLSIAAILWALPIWWTVINATKSTSDFFAHPFYALPREFNLLSNIRTAWDNAGLGTGFINSII